MHCQEVGRERTEYALFDSRARDGVRIRSANIVANERRAYGKRRYADKFARVGVAHSELRKIGFESNGTIQSCLVAIIRIRRAAGNGNARRSLLDDYATIRFFQADR